MELIEYLTTLSEACPAWLKNFDAKHSVFNRSDFFNSRVVFYPGSCYDGHAIKLFGSSHSAYCFVYCDYLTERAAIENVLDGEERGYNSPIKGYHSLARLSLTERDLSPKGWRPHIQPLNINRTRPSISPYAFLEVLERDPDLNNEFGAERLAILFLGADAHASYDALFCQNNGNRPPFGILLQDHGFGGNYSRFGNEGLMHQIAEQTQIFPDWLIVGETTDVWDGFDIVEDVKGDFGGMNCQQRRLYKKIF